MFLSFRAADFTPSCFLLNRFACSAESPCPLLVHFSAWRNSVQCEIEHVARASCRHKPIDQRSDIGKHLGFIFWSRRSFRVTTWVHDPIAVKVQIGDRHSLCSLVDPHAACFRGRIQVIINHLLKNQRILRAYPFKKRRHAHRGFVLICTSKTFYSK